MADIGEFLSQAGDSADSSSAAAIATGAGIIGNNVSALQSAPMTYTDGSVQAEMQQAAEDAKAIAKAGIAIGKAAATGDVSSLASSAADGSLTRGVVAAGKWILGGAITVGFIVAAPILLGARAIFTAALKISMNVVKGIFGTDKTDDDQIEIYMPNDEYQKMADAMNDDLQECYSFMKEAWNVDLEDGIKSVDMTVDAYYHLNQYDSGDPTGGVSNTPVKVYLDNAFGRAYQGLVENNNDEEDIYSWFDPASLSLNSDFYMGPGHDNALHSMYAGTWYAPNGFSADDASAFNTYKPDHLNNIWANNDYFNKGTYYPLGLLKYEYKQSNPIDNQYIPSSTADDYLAGWEGYFDINRAKDEFQTRSNEGKIYDMAYLVAAYDVSRREKAPSESGNWVTAIFKSYSWDISRLHFTELSDELGTHFDASNPVGNFLNSVTGTTAAAGVTLIEHSPLYAMFVWAAKSWCNLTGDYDSTLAEIIANRYYNYETTFVCDFDSVRKYHDYIRDIWDEVCVERHLQMTYEKYTWGSIYYTVPEHFEYLIQMTYDNGDGSYNTPGNMKACAKAYDVFTYVNAFTNTNEPGLASSKYMEMLILHGTDFHRVLVLENDKFYTVKATDVHARNNGTAFNELSYQFQFWGKPGSQYPHLTDVHDVANALVADGYVISPNFHGNTTKTYYIDPNPYPNANLAPIESFDWKEYELQTIDEHYVLNYVKLKIPAQSGIDFIEDPQAELGTAFLVAGNSYQPDEIDSPTKFGLMIAAKPGIEVVDHSYNSVEIVNAPDNNSLESTRQAVRNNANSRQIERYDSDGNFLGTWNPANYGAHFGAEYNPRVDFRHNAYYGFIRINKGDKVETETKEYNLGVNSVDGHEGFNGRYRNVIQGSINQHYNSSDRNVKAEAKKITTQTNAEGEEETHISYSLAEPQTWMEGSAYLPSRDPYHPEELLTNTERALTFEYDSTTYDRFDSVQATEYDNYAAFDKLENPDYVEMTFANENGNFEIGTGRQIYDFEDVLNRDPAYFQSLLDNYVNNVNTSLPYQDQIKDWHDGIANIRSQWENVKNQRYENSTDTQAADYSFGYPESYSNVVIKSDATTFYDKYYAPYMPESFHADNDSKRDDLVGTHPRSVFPDSNDARRQEVLFQYNKHHNTFSVPYDVVGIGHQDIFITYENFQWKILNDRDIYYTYDASFYANVTTNTLYYYLSATSSPFDTNKFVTAFFEYNGEYITKDERDNLLEWVEGNAYAVTKSGQEITTYTMPNFTKTETEIDASGNITTTTIRYENGDHNPPTPIGPVMPSEEDPNVIPEEEKHYNQNIMLVQDNPFFVNGEKYINFKRTWNEPNGIKYQPYYGTRTLYIYTCGAMGSASVCSPQSQAKLDELIAAGAENLSLDSEHRTDGYDGTCAGCGSPVKASYVMGEYQTECTVEAEDFACKTKASYELDEDGQYKLDAAGNKILNGVTYLTVQEKIDANVEYIYQSCLSAKSDALQNSYGSYVSDRFSGATMTYKDNDGNDQTISKDAILKMLCEIAEYYGDIKTYSYVAYENAFIPIENLDSSYDLKNVSFGKTNIGLKKNSSYNYEHTIKEYLEKVKKLEEQERADTISAGGQSGEHGGVVLQNYLFVNMWENYRGENKAVNAEGHGQNVNDTNYSSSEVSEYEQYFKLVADTAYLLDEPDIWTGNKEPIDLQSFVRAVSMLMQTELGEKVMDEYVMDRMQYFMTFFTDMGIQNADALVLLCEIASEYGSTEIFGVGQFGGDLLTNLKTIYGDDFADVDANAVRSAYMAVASAEGMPRRNEVCEILTEMKISGDWELYNTEVMGKLTEKISNPSSMSRKDVYPGDWINWYINEDGTPNQDRPFDSNKNREDLKDREQRLEQ